MDNGCSIRVKITHKARLMLQPVVRECSTSEHMHHIGEEAHRGVVDCHEDSRVDRCHEGVAEQHASHFLTILFDVVAEEADPEGALRDEVEGHQAGDDPGDEHGTDEPQDAEASGDHHSSLHADLALEGARHRDVVAVLSAEGTGVSHADHDCHTPCQRQKSQDCCPQCLVGAVAFLGLLEVPQESGAYGRTKRLDRVAAEITPGLMCVFGHDCLSC